MARVTPDPTFYASALEASAAPREKLGYVVTLNPAAATGGASADGRPDALRTVDLDPESSTYGELVGRLEMPNAGDELHHFGWNACSSALCPWAPHPHLERRYLLLNGVRSSRIHVVDVKEDPMQPPAHRPLRARRPVRQRAWSP